MFSRGSKSNLLNLKLICLIVTSSSVLLTNGNPASDDKIMFTDSDNIGKIMPKCSQANALYCTTVENYPATHFQNLINANLERYEALFGEDILWNPLGSRFDSPDEQSLCQSIERLIYPKAGPNMDDAWRFIYNDEKFRQGIRIEECVLNKNGPNNCSLTDSFPNGYITECRQNFIYRQLLTIDKDGKPVKDQFKFPSSCKCVVKNENNKKL